MSVSSPSAPGLSMGHEVSLFINSASFVGREVARRIVLQSAGFSREDSDEENPDDACVLCSLLRHSCCVRFFSWVETTYVPSYLALPFSSVWSSRLECNRTMRTMLEGSDLSVVCKDLHYTRQLLCETFFIFFTESGFGFVVERRAEAINWQSVLELVSSTRHRRSRETNFGASLCSITANDTETTMTGNISSTRTFMTHPRRVHSSRCTRPDEVSSCHPETVINWCKNFRMKKEDLEKAIASQPWRANMNRDLNY